MRELRGARGVRSCVHNQVGTVPRLDVMGAIAGGTTAYLTAEVARTSEYAMDVRTRALIVGLLVGAVVGWIMRRFIQHEAHDATKLSRWWPPIAAWVIGGYAASVIIVVSAHVARFNRLGWWVFEGIGLGALGTMLSIPACVWLTARARAAQRARRGSLVAASDARAITGALFACLALETLALAPRWRAAFFEVVDFPLSALMVAAVATIVGLWIVAADMYAARRIRKLVFDVAALDEIDHGEEESEIDNEVTDVGMGGELFVRDAIGETYRVGRSSVPLVRGAPDVAAYVMRRSVALSCLRLCVLLIPLAIHGYEALNPPDGYYVATRSVTW